MNVAEQHAVMHKYVRELIAKVKHERSINAQLRELLWGLLQHVNNWALSDAVEAAEVLGATWDRKALCWIRLTDEQVQQLVESAR